LKIIEYVFLIGRTNESRERHAVHQLYVVLLIGLSPRSAAHLAFKGGPPLSPENQKIWYALKIVRVVHENDAVWKQIPDVLDQLCLEAAFCIRHVTPSQKREAGPAVKHAYSVFLLL
jgi:hypothetical protein